MRTISKGLVTLLVSVLASPALAGITVTSYQTVALTNAFAPTSQTKYFAQETLSNVSPALAEVAGDWMGTNAGGSTITWHFVGESRATSTTAFDEHSLAVIAAGSFTYNVETTAGFIDPRSSSVYTPGGAADYQCYFALDAPAMHRTTVQLNTNSSVWLSSFETGFVFNRVNAGPVPILVELEGNIPAGHYQFRVNSSLGAPNFPNGVNHFNASGSFENLEFAVVVPEPRIVELAIPIILMVCGRNQRRAFGD